MPSYTRYLATTKEAVNKFVVKIFDTSSTDFLKDAIRAAKEIRYSPIMPAFLTRGEGPPTLPEPLNSIAFLFANAPYESLGDLRTELSSAERRNVYFTEGLASIILFNASLDRAKALRVISANCPLEYWPLPQGALILDQVFIEFPPSKQSGHLPDIIVPEVESPELGVYIEQITASLASLWSSYVVYFPTEQETLRQIAIHVGKLTEQYTRLRTHRQTSVNDLARLKDANAIKAALVEVSAALSYAVTQGTSGALPILSNRSPFPHHSLVGIGGAVRALTRFTRYLECAFMSRSASQVISNEYAKLEHVVPARIPEYNSGPEYKLLSPQDTQEEPFDTGGDFRQDDQVPLIAHFSLRHGYMESKYSVTAASEALSAETSPQWTIMTLSHEIMHSRVRTIFQALFGKTWNENDERLLTKDQFGEFAKWFQTRKDPKHLKVITGLRNVILYFCYALEKYYHPVLEADQPVKSTISLARLNDLYCRHKHLAIEILVHFHDYYFIYAYQPKLYVRSLWASWINVAGPYARPLEYLVRSLATVACGTGLKSEAAFVHAKEVLLEGLLSLETIGIKSPLFDELRRLIAVPAEGITRAHFDPCYYLIDSVRRYFASRTIASKIDRLESDHFADGSTSVDDYAANIYVFGEGDKISPIRYSVATLAKTLSGRPPIDDPQWLSAWNFMVLSS